EDVMPATDVASCVQQVVGFYRPHLERMFDDHVKRMRDLEALIVLAEPYIRLDRFLTDLAIEPPDFARPGDAPDAEDEFVTLSTIHSAKGLEWRSVFVLHLNDGQFPSAQALDDAERYEEERRLLYVAVTRAKRELYLIKPEFVSRRGGGRGWQGGGTVGELSPLLRDVDGFDDLVETTQHVVEADADDDGPVPDGGSPSAQRSGEVRAKLKRIDDFFGS
ncbi:MAG: 3'-5' exonuclease, partial [Acidobacteriota bacterium]